MSKTEFKDGETPVLAEWLNSVFGIDGHVHDGHDADGHAPKIDLQEHIEYGANGEVLVEVDTDLVHEILHRHSGGGEAVFSTDVVQSDRTEVQRLQPTDEGDREIEVDHPDGLVRLAIEGQVKTYGIWAQGSDIHIRDNEGDFADVVLDVHTVSTDVLRPNSSTTIEVQNVAGVGETELVVDEVTIGTITLSDGEDALAVDAEIVDVSGNANVDNITKGWCVIDAGGQSSGSPRDYETWSGFLASEGYQKNEDGRYTIFLGDDDDHSSPDSADDVGVMATLNEDVPDWDITTSVASTTNGVEVEVRIYDDQGDLADARCTVHFFWT